MQSARYKSLNLPDLTKTGTLAFYEKLGFFFYIKFKEGKVKRVPTIKGENQP